MNSVYTCRVQIPDKNLETLPKEGPRNRNHLRLTATQTHTKPTQLLQTLTRSSSVAEFMFFKSRTLCAAMCLGLPQAKAAYFKPETDCLARPSCHVPIEINYMDFNQTMAVPQRMSHHDLMGHDWCVGMT